jgi:STE24 endopeptidase
MSDGAMATATALVLLLAVLIVLLAVATPWRPLPGTSPRLPRGEPDLDFTAEERARERAFHRRSRPPAYGGMAVTVVALAALALTAAGSRLVHAVGHRTGHHPVLTAALGAVVVSAVATGVRLPFDIWLERVLRRTGLSTRSWRGFTADQLRGFGLSSVFVAVAGAGVVAAARARPATWPLLVAPAAALLVVVLAVVQPLLIEPVFNRFTPFPAGPDRDALVGLAARSGVPVRAILVADASRRTSALNAYVSGLGRTRRVVVYDTLLESGRPAETELVVAHELGHVRHRDVLVGTVVGAIGAAASVCALGLLLRSNVLLRLAHVSGQGDPGVVALLGLLASLFGMVGAPLMTLVSRRVEARADVFSLELTRAAQTFVRVERRLAVRNLADLSPNRIVYAVFATHPTPPQRIALARAWAAEAGVSAPGPMASDP